MSISVHHLTVRYRHHVVLNDIDFEVREGEFVCIVGKSGCGKTTLLHALAGFVPYSGEIIKPDHIGMVFQNHAVFSWMTVEENIGFGLSETMDKKMKQNIILEHLKLAGLEEKRTAYPGELSGGQVQRVALARTLANNPEVILMDEPYSSLDAHTREQMQTWLLDVWSIHKKTVIFVTHNIEEAIFLADRVLVLSEGVFTQEYAIPFARPRKDEIKFSQEFTALRRDIHALLKQ